MAAPPTKQLVTSNFLQLLFFFCTSALQLASLLLEVSRKLRKCLSFERKHYISPLEIVGGDDSADLLQLFQKRLLIELLSISLQLKQSTWSKEGCFHCRNIINIILEMTSWWKRVNSSSYFSCLLLFFLSPAKEAGKKNRKCTSHDVL